MPPTGTSHDGSIGPWRSVPRRAIGAALPGRTSTLNGCDCFEPRKNVSRADARTVVPPRPPGSTTKRSGVTSKSTRRSGSAAPTSTSIGALPRFSTMTSWRPRLLPRDVWGTSSADASLNAPTVIRPSSTVAPDGSAAARTRTPYGNVPARGDDSRGGEKTILASASWPGKSDSDGGSARA